MGVGKVRGPIAHEAAGRAGRSGRRPLSTLLPTGVGQRGLDDLARMVCLLGRSVPERRAEAVYDGRDPKPAERLAQRLLDEQLGAHSRFPGHALTPTGVMAIRCKQFHLPDL